MMVKSVLKLMAVTVSVLCLSACAVDPYAPSVCTDAGPNSPGWPYCGAGHEPGGPGPTDDRIDPTGRAPQ